MLNIKSHIGEVLSPVAGGRVSVRLHVDDAGDCCGCAIADICGAQGRGAVVEASLQPGMQATSMTGRTVRLRSTFGSRWRGARLFVWPCLLVIIVPVAALQLGADDSAAALSAFVVVAVVAVAAAVIRRHLHRKPAWIVDEIL